MKENNPLLDKHIGTKFSVCDKISVTVQYTHNNITQAYNSKSFMHSLDQIIFCAWNTSLSLLGPSLFIQVKIRVMCRIVYSMDLLY